MGVENYIKDCESSQCESLNIEGRLSYSHHECEDGYSVCTASFTVCATAWTSDGE